MTISVTCDGCERTLKAPDSTAGRKIKCPKCGAVVLVPEPDEDEEAASPALKKGAAPAQRKRAAADDETPRRNGRRDEEDEEDETPRRKKKKRKAQKSSPLLWVGIGGGVLALIIIIIVILLLNRPAAQPPARDNKDVANQDKKKGKEPVVERKLDLGADGKLDSPNNGTISDFHQSKENLRQLALAMKTYELERRKFPGAAILSKDGKKTPLLSWRVTLLPFLEQENLYRQFKLDEPWDSAHNKKLIQSMPKIYQPVRREHPEGGRTYYQVLTGKSGLFGEGREPRPNQITDGSSNTFLIVEGIDPVVWTKPEDLAYDNELKGEAVKKEPAANFKFRGGQPVTKIGGMFANGFCAALADGRAERFAREIPAWKIHALITYNGGEVFNLED